MHIQRLNTESDTAYVTALERDEGLIYVPCCRLLCNSLVKPKGLPSLHSKTAAKEM